VHKQRNVLGHLPEDERPWVKRKLSQAWALEDAAAAERRLGELARALQAKRPGAAASLREGLAETLTVTGLGLSVDSALARTLRSTNPIESMLSISRERSRNVKRWRGGEMVLRWTAAGMLDAERSFRRVRGHKELPKLGAALRRHATGVGKEVKDSPIAA
ncbi:MAG: transposase, partial [Chloroflexota bacterium]|nr:transposase [Chloroflexota bacterium]